MDLSPSNTDRQSEVKNEFGRTESERQNKVAEFEKSAYEMIEQCADDTVELMKAYAVNQSMRTMIDPTDTMLCEAYDARTRIYREEMLKRDVEEAWIDQWEK